MRTNRLMTVVLLGLVAAGAHAAEPAAAAWDGLVEVKSKRMDVAFVAPGADFRAYTKLMLDPTEVAFQKDWMKDMNDRRDLSRRVSDEQAGEMLQAARTNFAEVFSEVFGKAGFTIVTAPGPDVLRVSPGVLNLYVNAPDVMSAGRSASYTANAGEATMVLELRDSQTNALLGRVLDRRETRESAGMQQATRVSNVADFRNLFRTWANLSVKGLETLKSISPLPETLTPGQKVD
jgi:hypothetical protein